MRNLVCLVMVIFVLLPLCTINAQEDHVRVAQLQQLLQETNAGWTAGVTSMSQIPLVEFQDRLGLILSEDPEHQAQVNYTRPDLSKTTPKYVNWQAKGFVTSVKNQARCGSCYAFASCGLLESYYLITENLRLDLSEQYFMMKTKVGDLLGGCKGNNLWVCAATCIAYGPTTEDCCPYKAVEEACPSACSNKTYGALTATTGEVAGFQQVLSEQSPIAVGFMVYEDFRNYTGGVYKYVQGEFLGGHAVLIVGYNREQGYWIVKNSWGTDWGETCDGKDGERGYFRIAFNECLIEVPYMGPFYTPTK